MAVNMNPESGKPINNTETTYHKRGENEGIGLQEFIHRLSVFIKEHPEQIKNSGFLRRDGSIFSKPAEESLMANAEQLFIDMDFDGSGEISFEELKDAQYFNDIDLVAQYVKNAYNLDLVPDNPTNVLEDENGKIDKNELNGLGFNLPSDLSKILHQAKTDNK